MVCVAGTINQMHECVGESEFKSVLAKSGRTALVHKCLYVQTGHEVKQTVMEEKRKRNGL